jgi:hypothetical protein
MLDFMRPLTIHTRHFPPRGFYAITLFPFIFYRGRGLSVSALRHETVHLWQQAALLVLPFYVLYLVFWIVGLLRYRNGHRAYREIPFERSAYALVSSPRPSAVRQAFGWITELGRSQSLPKDCSEESVSKPTNLP